MNRFASLLGLVSALAMGGCDNGPSLNVVPEPAGANCPTGGFRVEADGEVFYSCDGQASTETVAAGAEGNPCIGAALRVTIPAEDGTTRYAYVCQPIETDPVAEGFLIGQFDLQIAAGEITCGCEEDPDVRAACESQYSLFASIAQASTACIGEVLAVAGPLPEVDRPAAQCVVTAMTLVEDCLNAIPTAECTMDTETALTECQELGAAIEACPEPSEALSEWRQHALMGAQLLGCPIFGGF